jgi:hypothetical protein
MDSWLTRASVAIEQLVSQSVVVPDRNRRQLSRRKVGGL